MSVNVSRNKREKYSEIKLTWWDTDLQGGNYLGRDVVWWLEDHISFKMGDDPVKIPIGGETGEGQYKTFFQDMHNVKGIIRNWPKRFPRNGDIQNARRRTSHMEIFGEDDNHTVTSSEFYNAGGDLQLEWDTDTYEMYILLSPPISKIGVNENFSITLEGSVPALMINENGYMLVKRETTFYTEFYGKTNNVLEVDLPHVVGINNAYRVGQKLLEKYSYGNTTFSVDYFQEDIPIVDNKQLVPQTVTIDSTGRRNTNDAFIYNRLDSIPQKPLSELGSTEHTLDDVQFYPLAFLS